MNPTTPLAILGLAAAAHAQTWTWHATPSGPTDILAGDPITWTLSAEMTAPDGLEFVGLSATIFDILSDLNGERGQITGWKVLNNLCDIGQCDVWFNGYELMGVNVGQLVVFGPFTSANPVDVLEFTWQAPDDLDAFEVDYATDTLSAYIWAGLPGEDPDQIEVLDIADASMHWTVNIPAPGALPLLGVAALAMRRRR